MPACFFCSRVCEPSSLVLFTPNGRALWVCRNRSDCLAVLEHRVQALIASVTSELDNKGGPCAR